MQLLLFRQGFNTQPPEGGWSLIFSVAGSCQRFNTQPPEGGWCIKENCFKWVICVSTHSRPKAAGTVTRFNRINTGVSTHSRPKAAGYKTFWIPLYSQVSTHSRPKAAGARIIAQYCRDMFQHTAARRRLGS